MRRTRNRKHRGGLFGFGESSNTPEVAPVVAPETTKKPGFFNSLFGKTNTPPVESATPSVSPAPFSNSPSVSPPVSNSSAPPSAQGGKRKNKCGMWGGSHFVGAPLSYNSVRNSGGQPSERIMQWATTAGGRRKHRTRRNKSHCKSKSHRSKSHRSKSHRKHRKN